MMDFDIKRTSRRCHATDRELKPGETFYSELVMDDGEMQRVDYCESAWQGPSEGCVGWWKSQIPKHDADRVYWAPRDVLVAYFDELIKADQKPDTIYVMALLLVRRRVLQLIETARDQQGREFMELRLNREKRNYRVLVQSPEAAEIERIQRELAEHLFVDKPMDEE